MWFAWLMMGIAIGAICIGVFDAPRFWELHDKNKQLMKLLEQANQEITHLRSLVQPRQWDEQWPDIIPRRREAIYDKYEELIQPGTEVIRIEDQEDY